MTKKMSLLFLTALGAISIIKSAVLPFNAYQGKLLTHERIIECSQMDDASKNRFEALLEQNKLIPVIQKLTQCSIFQTREERLKLREKLKEEGIRFMPAEPGHESINWNILVPPDKPEFVIKIPAAGLFRESINSALDRSWGTPVTEKDYEQCKLNRLLKRPWKTPVNPEEYEKVKNEIVKVDLDRYQGISRAAVSLVGREWVREQEQDFPIDFIQTSLWHIPDTPESLSDSNYVSVDPYISGLQPVEQKHFGDPKVMSAFNELVESRVGSALWDAKPSNIKVTPEGKLCVVDTESPNNDNPENFFGLDTAKVASNQKVAREKRAAFIKWAEGTGEWKE